MSPYFCLFLLCVLISSHCERASPDFPDFPRYYAWIIHDFLLIYYQVTWQFRYHRYHHLPKCSFDCYYVYNLKLFGWFPVLNYSGFPIFSYPYSTFFLYFIFCFLSICELFRIYALFSIVGPFLNFLFFLNLPYLHSIFSNYN